MQTSPKAREQSFSILQIQTKKRSDIDMKKAYTAPELELIKFDARDIITNSEITDPFEQEPEDW